MIYCKRGRWCVDLNGKFYKFGFDRAEAEAFLAGKTIPVIQPITEPVVEEIVHIEVEQPVESLEPDFSLENENEVIVES